MARKKQVPSEVSTVPATVRPVVDKIVGLTDVFCRAHLTGEYADLCRKLAAKLLEDRGLLRCFSEYKHDFERINTPEVAKLFEELDLVREKLSMLDSVRTGLAQLREQIDPQEPRRRRTRSRRYPP